MATERKDFNLALADLLEEYKDIPDIEAMTVIGIAYAVMVAALNEKQTAAVELARNLLAATEDIPPDVVH